MRTAWLVLVALGGCGDSGSAPAPAGGGDAAPRSLGVLDFQCAGDPGKPRVLVYTYENQWRHYSNLTAREAIATMCTTRGFTVSITNDVFALNSHQLAQVDVVVFAVTSGSGLDEIAHSDFEAWVRAGGGIVGLHSASSTEQGWSFYVDNIGPQFMTHVDGLVLGNITIEPVDHPITAGLSTFALTDEWYVFSTRPEDTAGVTPLLALDESSVANYPPELAQGHHVIGWTSEKYGGRVFYMAAGHNPDSYSDPNFNEIVARAVEWTAHQL